MNKDNLIMVRLYQTKWSGRQFDASASEDIAKDSGAEAGTARLNKLIVPKEVVTQTNTHWGAMRKWFYDQTSPFYDTGWRVRPFHDFQTFRSEYAELKDKADEFVDDLIENKYPEAMEKARTRMGELYDPSDYPIAEDLRDKFLIEMEMQPVPEVTHNWITKLDEETQDQIDATTKNAEENVAKEPWMRLYAPLNQIANALRNKIGDKGAIFRANAFENLPDVCNTAKAIAANPNDTDLNDCIDAILRNIASADLKQVRKAQDYRTYVYQHVQRALADIKNHV